MEYSLYLDFTGVATIFVKLALIILHAIASSVDIFFIKFIT